jgi:hypothetical protein
MPQDTPHKNRRLHTRRPPRRSLRITCRKGGLDLGKNLAAAVVDISEAGACVLLSVELPPRQEVSVSLEGIEHPRPLRLLANVVWCRPFGEQWAAGLQFQKYLPYREFLKLSQGASTLF